MIPIGFLYFCKVREVEIIIALGSNEHPRRNMKTARTLLSATIPSLRFTRNMITQPIGHAGRPYLNCLCRGTTTLPLNEVQALLKQVEHDCGDSAAQRAEGRVVMDVDLLEYDGTRHHEADWERDYILTLNQEINTNPLKGPTFKQ